MIRSTTRRELLKKEKNNIFEFTSKPNTKTHTALELNKRIQLGIEKQKKKRDDIVKQILNLIDQIQRDMNAGQAHKIYETEATFLNFDNDLSLKNDFITTVKTLATHRNHFFGTTKINWFGHTNNTKSIEALKELFLKDPGLIVEDYPNGFFLEAKVQDLPEQHYKNDLRHAMSMLFSDGVHGSTRSYGNAQFTQTQDGEVEKSARFGCCSVTLYKNGKLDIQFFKPSYIFTSIANATDTEAKDKEQQKTLFYNKSNHSFISWKKHQERMAKETYYIPTSTSFPSVPSASADINS